jgi:putative FmdB family regulatory protein
MPTYDYVCGACGHAFERFQEMSAKKLRTCPTCRKAALERQVGAGAGLIFKGSGFYITDYKRSGSAPAKDAGPSDGGAACTPPPGGCGQPACPGAADKAPDRASERAPAKASKKASKKA